MSRKGCAPVKVKIVSLHGPYSSMSKVTPSVFVGSGVNPEVTDAVILNVYIPSGITFGSVDWNVKSPVIGSKIDCVLASAMLQRSSTG